MPLQCGVVDCVIFYIDLLITLPGACCQAARSESPHSHSRGKTQIPHRWMKWRCIPIPMHLGCEIIEKIRIQHVFDFHLVDSRESGCVSIRKSFSIRLF